MVTAQGQEIVLYFETLLQTLHVSSRHHTHCSALCVFLTLSDPDSEETEEAEECCWGLEMDMGESALWGDTESLCCSSEPPPPPSTQGSCSDAGSFGGETMKHKEEMSSVDFYDFYKQCIPPNQLPELFH